MNYIETVEFLYQSLPMYQRIGAAAYKADLTNTWALCEALGNPQNSFKSIHIAGTNGKGSTSHMLASVLQTSGYKTGLYTSPHLKEFTERIKINGKDVLQQFVLDFVQRVIPVIEHIKPSFFEITVAMAFDYFAHEKVDIAVIEVGLGGRLDSTNVINPVLSVITNISWDHMNILGDTLDKIAFEKAGIIKKNVPVIVSERQDVIDNVFLEQARKTGSSISFSSDSIKINRVSTGVFEVSNNGKLSRINLDLLGHYQVKNLGGVLSAIGQLRALGYSISEQQMKDGLAHVTTNTGLRGRWQLIGTNPTIICDTGHNEAGIREILSQLSEIEFDRLHMVIGMVNDKDVSKILSLLPLSATYYFCQASIPRAMDAKLLQEKASEYNLSGEVFKSVNEAIKAAKDNSKPNDLIFVGGSTFIVAEIENL